MRIFKYKNFERWAEDEDVSDQMLLKAVREIRAGLFDSSLGSGLYKKRVARLGQGKSGGYRVLLAFRYERHIFFLHGFAKNQQGNINDAEQKIYRDLAKYLAYLDTQAIDKLIKMNEIIEVIYESKKETHW